MLVSHNEAQNVQKNMAFKYKKSRLPPLNEGTTFIINVDVGGVVM